MPAIPAFSSAAIDAGRATQSRPGTPYPPQGAGADAWSTWLNDPRNQAHVDYLNRQGKIDPRNPWGSLDRVAAENAGADPTGGGSNAGAFSFAAAPSYETRERPDILTEQWGRWNDEFGSLRDEGLAAGQAYADQLTGYGEDYGSALRGSEGYAGLQNYGDEMRALYEAGGLTDVTRANLERSRREADQFVRANREAALMDLAERGMSGGGAEIAALMGDRAAAADRMSARDLDTNAFAQQQALDALGIAADTDRELFGVDQDIAQTQLGLNTAGAEEMMSINSAMNQEAIGTWNRLFDNAVAQGAAGWQTAQNGVLPATESALSTLSNAAREGRTNAAGTISGGAVATGGFAGGLAGTAGGQPPTLGQSLPGVPTQVGATTGAAADAGISGGAQIIGGLYNALTNEGKEDGEDGK